MFRALDPSPLGRGPHALGASRNQVLARDLAGSAPTIEESWTGGAVLDLCASHPAIPSFAVVEGEGRVIGLIERERLYYQFSHPLWFDVYNRRPIAPLVTREAMVVDGTTPIEGVKELIAYRYPQAISSGFAIVEQNRYLGIGTMTALLEKTVDLAHRRAIELEEAHRKAEIASEAKSRFLATMSHELRTPLNAIIGFAELLLMRDVDRMEADQRRGYVTDIRNSGAHLLALINDILDYSKLEADHLPLVETVFDLRQFLHDGLRLVRTQAETANVTLRTMQAPAIALTGDERRLRQCVVKLLANAIQFAPGGEVGLSAVMVGAQGLEIRVADTGCGIPADQLEQVFQPIPSGGERAEPGDQRHRPWLAFEPQAGGASWRQPAPGEQDGRGHGGDPAAAGAGCSSGRPLGRTGRFGLIP
ncbi:MAG TPA: histidine kinase dimerization/phospho-acceptor domain-containing protein [Dongiaceae bacterium]|jgi:two-component system cell cycle sensor histidine kinase PleC|nr:histidine kinase dimerization/phospho-acceptor domain-containing protein [Dongiaceae bacterium]